MEWVQAFTPVLGALAWPLVVVALALTFRKGIAHVLENLKRGQFGNWVFEVEQRRVELQAAVREVSEEMSPQQRRRLELTIHKAAIMGYQYGEMDPAGSVPKVRIDWQDDVPTVWLSGKESPIEKRLRDLGYSPGGPKE